MAAHAEAATAKKAVTAGAIGNFVEWYDYSVYGFFATVIASQFFPSEDRVASLLVTFAVFAVAFFMRPVGAVFTSSQPPWSRWSSLAP